MTSHALQETLVDGGAVAPRRRWACVISLASMVLAAGLAATTLWDSTSSAPDGVIFPAPTSLEHANELLVNLPQMEPEKLYEIHVAPHITTLYTFFLEYFGSTAPHLLDGAVSNGKMHKLGSEDFKQRLPVFEGTVMKIIKLNMQTYGLVDRATFAITLFADWTPDEFQSILGDKRPGESEDEKLEESPSPPAHAEAAVNVSEQLMLTSTGCGYCPSVSYANSCGGYYCTAGHPYHSGHKCYSKCPPVLPPNRRRRTGRVPAYSRNWATTYPHVFERRTQGACGSCWAHSATESLRQVYAVGHGGEDVGKLSVQYLVDCVYPTAKCKDGVKGCCGGSTPYAFGWVHQHGGVPTQAEYGEYQSGGNAKIAHTCRHVPNTLVTSGARMLHSEKEMATAMYSGGPIAIGIFASDAWMSYSSGVLQAPQCSSTKTNHAVQLVGYDSKEAVWIVMNSWGSSWGVAAAAPYKHSSTNGGFILLAYGTNTCNILSHPAMPQNVVRAGAQPSRRRRTLSSDCGYCPRESDASNCGGYYCTAGHPWHYGTKCYTKCPAAGSGCQYCPSSYTCHNGAQNFKCSSSYPYMRGGSCYRHCASEQHELLEHENASTTMTIEKDTEKLSEEPSAEKSGEHPVAEKPNIFT